MTEVVQAPDLQALIVTIADVRGWVSRLGDPSHLAGDPASLRRLSISHRETAASLRTLTRLGFNDAQRVTQSGAWEGAAANSFSAYWTDLANRVEDLASRHDQMASALSSVAAEAERLNADVLSVHDALSRWLSLASQSVLSMDRGQVGRLVNGGQELLRDWERLVADVHAFTARVVRSCRAELGFVARSVSPTDKLPLRRAPIDIQRLPSSPGQFGSRPRKIRPGPQRLPPGTGRGLPGWNPPVAGGQPDYPPGPGPGPGRKRSPKPDGPPTIAPGVGQAPGPLPRGRERERSPGEKGIPVVGHPPAAHPPPHGAALGPAAAGPLDAPILQGAALATAIMRRIQQRSKSGNAKGGGKSAGPKK
jgi:uncharacterized protein YukE